MRPAVLLEGLEPRTLLSRAIGVDVSSAQGQPTWSSAFSGGVQFAYAKATEGTGYTNPDFTYDMSNGTAAGVVMGAYDYARYDAVSATAEANYFLSVAGPYAGAGYLRPMLDVEQASSLTKSQLSAWVDTWCSTVYQATGVKPIIYVSSGNAPGFFDSTVTQWYNWMASWPTNPNPQTGSPSGTAPWSGWNIWQYADNGNISGIGTVDMDVANGDMTSYVIPQLVGGSSQFSKGEVVYVTARSGLNAYTSYTSNGTPTLEPNGTGGVIQGGPVYINGYLRWPIIYSGSSTVMWSAGAYLAADIPSVASFFGSPNPVIAGNNVTLAANATDPNSTVSSVLFYRENDGTAGLQSGRGGDALLGYGTSNGSGGWTISTSTSGLSGSITYYAVATNAGGASSAPASTTVTVRVAPMVSLTSTSPNPSTTAQSLAFNATVAGGVPDGETVALVDTSNDNATVATGTLSGGSATLNVPAGTLAAGTHNLVATYGGDANLAASESAAYAQVVQAAPPSLVGAPVINGDNPNGLYNAPGQPAPGVQRSMVEDIVYTFSEPVMINDANAAFTMALVGQMTGTLPATLYAAALPGSNGTQWAVSLTGQAVGVFGSIANGEYSITINPSAVFAAADGITPMSTGRTDTFYRLFGDLGGDRVVNAQDIGKMKTALSTYNPALDANWDGTDSALDVGRLKPSLSISFANDGFVTSI